MRNKCLLEPAMTFFTLCVFSPMVAADTPGNTNWKGRLSAVGFLELTSLDQLLLILATSFTFYRTSHINKEVNCTEPSPSVSFPWIHPSVSVDTPRNTNWKGRLSTVDLLELTSLDQLILILPILFTFYNTSKLNKEVNRTEPFPLVSFPWIHEPVGVDTSTKEH